MEEEDEFEALVVLKRVVCNREDVIEFVREEDSEVLVVVALDEEVDEVIEVDDSCATEEEIDIKDTIRKDMEVEERGQEYRQRGNGFVVAMAKDGTRVRMGASEGPVKRVTNRSDKIETPYRQRGADSAPSGERRVLEAAVVVMNRSGGRVE